MSTLHNTLKLNECRRAQLLETCSLNEPQWSRREKSIIITVSIGVFPNLLTAWNWFRSDLSSQLHLELYAQSIQCGVGGSACFMFLCQLPVSYRKTDWTDLTHSDKAEVTQIWPVRFYPLNFSFDNFWFCQNWHILILCSVLWDLQCFSLCPLTPKQYWLSHKTLAWAVIS